MKFDITKLFTTRNGLKVRILCTDRMCVVGDACHHPIVGLITEKWGYEVVGLWNHDGTWTDSDNPDPYDLVNIPPPKRVMYVNVYNNDDIPDGLVYSSSSTRRDADMKASLHRQACVRVEYVDGQMDD